MFKFNSGIISSELPVHAFLPCIPIRMPLLKFIVLEKELSRSKDEFIKEHIVKYGKSEYPPAWKTLKLATFIKTTTYNRNAIRREFIDRKLIFYIMCTCISL